MEYEKIKKRIDAINNAIAMGINSVKFENNKEITYRSLDEMLKIRNILMSQISNQNENNSRGRRVSAIFNKGL